MLASGSIFKTSVTVFSLYGPPSRQITYISYYEATTASCTKLKRSLTGILLPTRCFAAILFWPFSKCHVIKISKIFGDFVPRDPAFARVFSQPRPQGLLLDDFQNGRSSAEDPGTQQKSRDRFVHGGWKFIQHGGQDKE